MEFKENFKRILNKIESPISDFLLDPHNHNIDEEIDNIDVSSKEGYVSFNRNGRDVKVKKKAGRFVSMFTDSFTPREIEIFVNEYKSLSGFYKYIDNFELGSGDDFKEGYNVDCYAERSGSLGSSCMNNAEEDRLKLYIDNPNKVKILMLKDKDGKVLARSIVWKNAFIREGESAEDRNNSEPFKKWVMDRVYSNKDFYINIFEQYASSKGWYTRHGGGLNYKRPDGEIVKCRIKVKLKEFEFGNYPYLDTMRSMSKKGTISNKRWKQEVRFW